MSWEDGDPLGMRLRIAPGATLSSDPSTYPWQDVSSDVAWDQPITLTTGSAEEQSDTNSQLVWTFRDNRGRYDVENAESDLYGTWDVGTPVELAVNLGDGSGWQVVAIMYVAEVGDDYTTAPHRTRRDIIAAGMFRRIGQNPVLASAITRNMRSTKAVRYYRLEDGGDSRQAVSDVAGVPPMMQLNGALPAFASRTGVAGSTAVPSFTAGTTLNVNFATYFPSGSLTWQWLQNVKTLTVNNQLTTMRTAAPKVAAWFTFQDPGFCPRLRAIDGLGNTLYTSTAFGIQAGMVGDGSNRPDNHPWWWCSVKLTQVGADTVIDYRMTAQYTDALGNGQLVQWILSSDTLTSTTALGGVTGFTIAANGVVEDVAIGHMGLFDGAISTPLNNGTGAVIGWPQSAGDRIAGVANEAGLPNSVTVSPTVVLGPQQPGNVLALLRDGAKADHGILDDSLGKVGYRGLYDLYNLTPLVVLDGSNREIFHPFVPVRDDQKRKNQITVSRPGGSTATVEDVVDQAKSGLYNDSPNLNLGSDADLPSHAQLGVTIGTQPGKRYPAVTLDLLRAPQLARSWLAMRLGDRFQVNNPPRGGTRAGVQLQLRGTSQTWLNRRIWQVTCNTVRADPYNVGSLEDPVLGRAEADEGSVTVPAEIDRTTTSFSVATAAGHPLPVDSATLPGDFPFSLIWDGEEILVQLVTGTSSPQTFVVQRSVNGVRKSHKINSILRLKTPMRPAL